MLTIILLLKTYFLILIIHILKQYFDISAKYLFHLWDFRERRVWFVVEDASWYFWCSAPTSGSFGVTAEISGINSSSRICRLKFVGTLVLSFLDLACGECSTILKSSIEIKIWGQLGGVSERKKRGRIIKQFCWDSEFAASTLLMAEEEFSFGASRDGELNRILVVSVGSASGKSTPTTDVQTPGILQRKVLHLIT